jgi:hypothetical protein
MAGRGRSIHLFLMDGDPGGRIKCTLANWTGVVYKIPRTELDACKGRDDLSQSGVYFLFGTSDQTGEPVVYIGQAGVRKNGEGILYRLQEHKRNPDKDYWVEAVVFTTSDNSLANTEIGYLENRFCKLATDAKRYLIKNGNEPSAGHITEEKECELEEFIDNAKIVMGALGHKVFEPLSQPLPSAPAEAPQTAEEALFYITRSGAAATCKLTHEGVVLLAGSLLRREVLSSCPAYTQALRAEYAAHLNAEGVLQRDILFKTPSGASAFVLGAPTNGYVEWKTAEGQSLKDIEAGRV